MEIHGHVVQIEAALLVGIGMYGDVPVGIHPEVAQAPAAHVVELFGLFGGPARRGSGNGDGLAPDGGEGAIVMGYGSRRKRLSPYTWAMRRRPTLSGDPATEECKSLRFDSCCNDKALRHRWLI